MVSRKRNFYAYELDFVKIHNVNGEERYKYIYDYDALKEIFMRCKNEELVDIRQIYDTNWFLTLEDVCEFVFGENHEKYLSGRFITGEYGRVGDLRNVDTMASRRNTKEKREGEEKYLYFAIREKDGLLLMQGDLRVSRNKIYEYLNIIGEEIIKRKGYLHAEVSTLLKKDFVDEINSINVTSLEVELAVEKEAAYENEVLTAVRNSAREFEANYVKVEWLAKYSKDKLKGLNQFVEKIIPRGSKKPIKGVNNIKVRGKDGDEIKTIYISKLSEKHEITLEFDEFNNPKKNETYLAFTNLMLRRELIGKV